MQRWILALLAALTISHSVCAQSAGQPNEGLTLAQDPTSGAFTLSWWAIAGRTYFIQESSDLFTWNFLPLMETASDQIIAWGFTSSESTLFLRLRYTDTTYTEWAEANGYDPEFPPFPPDPFSLAPGGSGLTLLQCYQNGYNPWSYYAGLTPTLTIISGNNQFGTPRTTLPLPLVVEVRDQNNNLLVNAPVQFVTTSSDDGFANPSSVTTGSDGRASTTFTTSSTIGAVSTVTAYAATSPLEGGVNFTVGNVPLPPPPAPPSNVVVVQNPDGSIDMTWLSPADNTASFDIQIRDTTGEWVTIGTVPPNTASVHINPDQTIAQ